MVTNEAKKRRSRSLGNVELIDKLVQTIEQQGLTVEKTIQLISNNWCGGWDLNPRRPTPSGPEPHAPCQPNTCIDEGIDGSDEGSQQNEGFQVPYGSAKLVVTNELIEDFKKWLKEDNPDITEKTLKGYINRLKELLNKELTGDVLREFAARTKWHYMTATRLLSFLKKKYKLRNLAEELREALGRRPKSGHDTWLPPDNLVLKAGKVLAETGRIYYATWLLLVSTGARLKEIHYAFTQVNWEKKLVCLDSFCRLHIDFERGPKNAWELYMPKNIADYITSTILYKEYVPSYDSLEKAVKNAGVAAKYYRNWVSNKMLVLGIPEAVIEFVTGKAASSVLRKHYLQLQYQADTFYPRYAKWLQKFIHQSFSSP